MSPRQSSKQAVLTKYLGVWRSLPSRVIPCICICTSFGLCSLTIGGCGRKSIVGGIQPPGGEEALYDVRRTYKHRLGRRMWVSSL